MLMETLTAAGDAFLSYGGWPLIAGAVVFWGGKASASYANKSYEGTVNAEHREEMRHTLEDSQSAAQIGHNRKIGGWGDTADWVAHASNRGRDVR